MLLIRRKEVPMILHVVCVDEYGHELPMKHGHGYRDRLFLKNIG